MYPVW
jgi:hypothetical protein